MPESIVTNFIQRKGQYHFLQIGMVMKRAKSYLTNGIRQHHGSHYLSELLALQRINQLVFLLVPEFRNGICLSIYGHG